MTLGFGQLCTIIRAAGTGALLSRVQCEGMTCTKTPHHLTGKFDTPSNFLLRHDDRIAEDA